MTRQTRQRAIWRGLAPAIAGLVFSGCAATDGPLLQRVDASSTPGTDGAVADGAVADGTLADAALADGTTTSTAEGSAPDGMGTAMSSVADAADSSPLDADSGDANDGACTYSLDSDSHNCGSCGHDCLGGACAAGQCQPVLLATAPTPFATLVDDKRVYFASSDGDPGQIMSIAKDGSDPQVLVTGIDQCHAMYLQGTRLFWGETGVPGRIGSVDTNGANPLLLAQEGAGPGSIVADQASVYALDLAAFSVLQVPITGEPDAGPATVLTTGWTYPYVLTQDSKNLYWTAQGDTNGELGSTGPFDGGIHGKIAMMPKDGSSAAMVIADNLTEPLWIAVDATGVYWTDWVSGVMRLPAGSTEPVVLLASSDTPYAITLDGNDLYFSTLSPTQTNGTIQRMPKDGSAPPVVLVQNLLWPSQIAVDATAIYWGNTHGSTVMKLAK
jgi:hypothetical protein